MELLRFRFYAWLFELTSFQDIPVFLCQILLNALVCCSILSIDSTFLLALVNIMQKIDKMYAAFTGQPLEKVQQYTERDRFLSVSEVIFLSPLFFFNLFIFSFIFFFFFLKNGNGKWTQNICKLSSWKLPFNSDIS